MAEDEVTNLKELTRLKNRRRSYKGSITTRIETLKRLLGEGGSRTKILFLHDKLKETFNEVTAVATEIHRLTDDFADEDWFYRFELMTVLSRS